MLFSIRLIFSVLYTCRATIHLRELHLPHPEMPQIEMLPKDTLEQPRPFPV